MISRISQAIQNFPRVPFWQHHRLVAVPYSGKTKHYSFRNFEGRYRHLHVAIMCTPQPTKAISQQSLQGWCEKPSFCLSLQNEGLNHLHFHETFYDFQCTK